MIVYVVLIVYVLLIGLFYSQNVKHNKKIFCFMLFIALFFIMANRDLSVGVDSLSYYRIYLNVERAKWSQILNYKPYYPLMEFIIIMKICSIIVSNFFFFQAVVSVLYCAGMIKFIYDNCSNLFLSSIIFISCGLYLGAFNISREMLAVMIMINGWTLLSKDKYKGSIILFLLGVAMHFSSLVFALGFFAYFIINKWSKLVKIAPPMIIIAGIFYENLIELAQKYFPIYSNYYTNHKILQTAGGVKIIWAIVILLAIYNIYISKKQREPQYQFAAICSIVYVVTNVIGLFFNYFERIGTYFLPFTLLLFESIGLEFRSKWIRILYNCSVGVCYIGYFFLSCASEQYQYSFFF